MKVFYKLCAPISFLVVTVIFAIVFAVNKIYPFGSYSISWCDMDQQTIPLLCEFKDVLLGKSDFWFSLKNAGGMNFYGVYLFNLSSPITYLVLFFEKSEMVQAVNVMVVLKIALAALTFAIWLRREVPNANPIIIIAISVGYAFSGYAMLYYQILSWLDTVYLFPILLLGLKMLKEGKSPLVYILSLFACFVCHFYLGYIIVVFICLYGALNSLLDKENRSAFCKNFLISSIISALLSAIVIIPAFLQYSVSMRGKSIFQSLAQSTFFPHVETTFPTFLSLLLVAPFILNIAKRVKFELLDILFALMLVPVFIEPIAKAWQTFNYMSFPSRYGFVTVALGLTVATKGIVSITSEDKNIVKAKQNEKIKLLFSGVAFLFCILFSVYSYKYFNANKEVLSAYTKSLWGNENSLKSLLIYYLIPLFFVVLVYVATHYKVMHKIAVYALIATLFLVDAFFSSSVYMVMPATSNSGKYNVENYAKVFELEDLIEDDSFYRVKCYNKSFDVNLVGALGYNSLSHYTSLNRESYMMAIKQLGYSSYWMETHSNGGTVFTDALLRNKYTIYSGSSSSSVYSTQNFYVKENEILFPTAFIISQNGDNVGDISLPRWQIQEKLFNRLTGKSGLYEEYKHTNLSDATLTVKDGKTQIKLSKNKGYIYYNFVVNGTKSIYFDCFDKYSNSLREDVYDSVSRVSVTANNRVTAFTDYPNSSRNGTLYLGRFTNTTVTVKVDVKSDVNALSFGVIGVDNELLESAVNSVIGGDFTVIKDKLTGKITASEGDALFTSFAYDEGYRVKINGKKAETFSVNGFLAVKLNAGENQVVVDFMPRGFYLGLALFLLGALLCALYLIFYKKIQKIKFIEKPSVLAVYALGILVGAVIYLFPVAFYLIV